MKTTTMKPTTTQLVANHSVLAARAAAIAKATPKGRRQPRPCACGCGGWTKGGTWLPGHDAKALSRMIAAARTEAEMLALDEPETATETEQTA